MYLYYVYFSTLEFSNFKMNRILPMPFFRMQYIMLHCFQNNHSSPSCTKDRSDRTHVFHIFNFHQLSKEKISCKRSVFILRREFISIRVVFDGILGKLFFSPSFLVYCNPPRKTIRI